MKLMKKRISITAIVLGLAFMSACSNYDPVAASECGAVVRHAQKVLGSLAPSRSDMMADCKKASDNERGCVMASDKKGALAQCM